MPVRVRCVQKLEFKKLCHTYVGSVYHSNIKILDLSHNMISKIGSGFFRPAEVSLTHLHLAHNQLTVISTHFNGFFAWRNRGDLMISSFVLFQNTSKDVFGNMQHLHWLDLSYNLLNEMDYDSFRNSRRLQVHSTQHLSIRLLQSIFTTLNFPGSIFIAKSIARNSTRDFQAAVRATRRRTFA